jgi:hypothetical protein
MAKENYFTVQGEATKHNHGGIHLKWDCPFTDKEMWAQGEFATNKDKTQIKHKVYDDNDDVLYIVKAIL